MAVNEPTTDLNRRSWWNPLPQPRNSADSSVLAATRQAGEEVGSSKIVDRSVMYRVITSSWDYGQITNLEFSEIQRFVNAHYHQLDATALRMYQVLHRAMEANNYQTLEGEKVTQAAVKIYHTAFLSEWAAQLDGVD